MVLGQGGTKAGLQGMFRRLHKQPGSAGMHKHARPGPPVEGAPGSRASAAASPAPLCERQQADQPPQTAHLCRVRQVQHRQAVGPVRLLAAENQQALLLATSHVFQPPHRPRGTRRRDAQPRQQPRLQRRRGGRRRRGAAAARAVAGVGRGGLWQRPHEDVPVAVASGKVPLRAAAEPRRGDRLRPAAAARGLRARGAGAGGHHRGQLLRAHVPHGRAAAGVDREHQVHRRPRGSRQEGNRAAGLELLRGDCRGFGSRVRFNQSIGPAPSADGAALRRNVNTHRTGAPLAAPCVSSTASTAAA